MHGRLLILSCFVLGLVLTLNLISDARVEHDAHVQIFSDSQVRHDQYFDASIVPLWQKAQTVVMKGHKGMDLHTHYFENQSKTIVVILHGFRESPLKYRETAYDFYKLGFSVLLVNLRGHGLSGRSTPDLEMIHVKNHEYYLEDVEIVLNHDIPRKYNQTIIFGHSLGGAIAALYAARYQRKNLSLILSAPMLGLNTRHIPMWLIKFLVKTAVKIGFEDRYVLGQGPRNIKKWVFDASRRGTSSRERFERYRRDVLALDAPLMGGPSYGFLNAAFELISALQKEPSKNLRTPTLLLSGGRDRVVDLNSHKKFCSTAMNCTYKFLAEARHAIFFENKEIHRDFMASIHKFMEENNLHSRPFASSGK